MFKQKPMLQVLTSLVMLMVVGCASNLPQTSRTGTIHDVNFDERMSPTTLNVRVGDEVRWVNHRSSPIQLEFLEGALQNVVCARGFSDRLGRPQEEGTIRPNESVSLCFGTVGEVTYNARMETAVAGGQIESGVVNIRR